MSAEALSAVLHHSRAQGTTQVVLLGIAWHTSDNPELGCFPSQQTLANYANVSVRQVKRAIRELEDLGEIEIIHHGGIIGSGNNTTNIYYMRLDCPEDCDGSLWHRYMTEKLSTGYPRKVRSEVTSMTKRGDIRGKAR
jgi:DNA-binding transcriptional regulator YhcF (GntR family)